MDRLGRCVDCACRRAGSAVVKYTVQSGYGSPWTLRGLRMPQGRVCCCQIHSAEWIWIALDVAWIAHAAGPGLLLSNTQCRVDMDRLGRCVDCACRRAGSAVVKYTVQ